MGKKFADKDDSSQKDWDRTSQPKTFFWQLRMCVCVCCGVIYQWAMLPGWISWMKMPSSPRFSLFRPTTLKPRPPDGGFSSSTWVTWRPWITYTYYQRQLQSGRNPLEVFLTCLRWNKSSLRSPSLTTHSLCLDIWFGFEKLTEGDLHVLALPLCVSLHRVHKE